MFLVPLNIVESEEFVHFVVGPVGVDVAGDWGRREGDGFHGTMWCHGRGMIGQCRGRLGRV